MYIAVYVPTNGEAYFTDFMVTKGDKVYDWQPSTLDYYKDDVNLYKGGTLDLKGIST
jgi:hypothetical protein